MLSNFNRIKRRNSQNIINDSLEIADGYPGVAINIGGIKLPDAELIAFDNVGDYSYAIANINMSVKIGIAKTIHRKISVIHDQKTRRADAIDHFNRRIENHWSRAEKSCRINVGNCPGNGTVARQDRFKSGRENKHNYGSGNGFRVPEPQSQNAVSRNNIDYVNHVVIVKVVKLQSVNIMGIGEIDINFPAARPWW